MNSRQAFSIYFYIFMAVLTSRTTRTTAYTSRSFGGTSSKRQSRQGRLQQPQHQGENRWTMYAPPSSPTSQTAPMIAQNMLKNVASAVGGGSGGERSEQQRRRGSNWKLSHSVLASCDTLPSFPTAHGILSPETVSRMDEMTDGGHGNEAVSSFLKTYRQHGPMSCLEMLSDPEILPHLTKAMRDIV